MTTPYASEAFLHQLLSKALAAQASDVHLKVGLPPGARVRGDLVYFRVEKIKAEDTEAVVKLLLGGALREGLDDRVVAYEAAGLGRFRATIYRQRGSLALVLRPVPAKASTVEHLGLPAAVSGLVELPRGLVVVAGGAASGRSTTLAALVGQVLAAAPRHVITVEQPIELVHEDGRGSVSQREVGADTASLVAGLRAALVQDADLIVAGSLDAEGALEAALDAADAGRLVLGALTALDVRRALARLGARLTPPARERLVDALQGVLAQRLAPKRDGSGVVVVAELLVVTPAVRDALRRSFASAPHALPLDELFDQGAAQGAQSFASHVAKLVAQGAVSRTLAAVP